MNYTDEQIETIAMVCHEANRALCVSEADFSIKEWAAASNQIRESAIRGVRFRLENPDATPQAQHDEWSRTKISQGWRYGKEKNEKLKTHPCLVPYPNLPEFQQKKDKLFQAIVDALK